MNALDFGFVVCDYDDGGEVDDIHDDIIQQMVCLSIHEGRQGSKYANLNKVVWGTEGMFVGGSYIFERFSGKETKEFVNSMVYNQRRNRLAEYL
jgi:hypothetical protein